MARFMVCRSDSPEVDPVELLRAMLSISPEDAAQAQKDAAKVTGRGRAASKEP